MEVVETGLAQGRAQSALLESDLVRRATDEIIETSTGFDNESSDFINQAITNASIMLICSEIKRSRTFHKLACGAHCGAASRIIWPLASALIADVDE